MCVGVILFRQQYRWSGTDGLQQSTYCCTAADGLERRNLTRQIYDYMGMYSIAAVVQSLRD